MAKNLEERQKKAKQVLKGRILEHNEILVEPSVKDIDNFRRLFAFFLEHMPIEYIESFQFQEVYYRGVSYYAKKYGKLGSKLLNENDINVLSYLNEKEHKTAQEVSNITGLSLMEVVGSLRNLQSKALASAYQERVGESQLYRLTPYGREVGYKLLNNEMVL